MKRWIKRTLVAVFGATALFAGIGAWAQYRHHGWQPMNDQEAAAMKARVVEKISGRLALDAAQKAKLETLADALREQRKALIGSTTDPRAELQGLIAGNTFDRTRATQLIEGKVAAVTARSPAVVTALADFFDSLKPEQQAQVRAFMAQRGHRGHGAREGHGA
jgi:Spy/CpxP family protein refolding chaperone